MESLIIGCNGGINLGGDFMCIHFLVNHSQHIGRQYFSVNFIIYHYSGCKPTGTNATCYLNTEFIVFSYFARFKPEFIFYFI